jgi:hypothetical protein
MPENALAFEDFNFIAVFIELNYIKGIRDVFKILMT